MKKLILPMLTLFCLLGTLNVHAQVDATLNPIGLLFGDFNVGADFALANNFSVELAVGIGTSKVNEVKGNNIPVNMVGKFYVSPKHGTDRFYVDAFLRYVNRQWNYDDGADFVDYTSNRFGLGFGLGYKAVSRKGFVFDIGFGVGRALIDNNVFKDNNGNREAVEWPSVMFLGKLGIGYRFGGSKDR